MKRFSKLVSFAAVLSTLVTLGCSNLTNDTTTVSEKTSIVQADKTKITVNVKSDEDIVLFSNARTIMPDALSASTLNFYIYGKCKLAGGADIGPDPVSFQESSTPNVGVVTLDIPASYYDFTLYALTATGNGALTTKDKDDVENHAVLMGYANADLRYDQSISFYLTANKLSTVGGVSLQFYADSTWDFDAHSITSAQVGIWEQTQNPKDTPQPASVANTAKGFSNDDWKKSGTGAGTTDTIDITVASGIAPGTYNVVCLFEYNSKKYEWSDKIIILPGQTTTALIPIPDVIEYEPEAPTNLTAYYKEPEKNGNYYNVLLTWTDNSNCEEYFELQLAELSSTQTFIELPKDELDGTLLAATGKPDYTKYNLTTSGANDTARAKWEAMLDQEWGANALSHVSTYGAFKTSTKFKNGNTDATVDVLPLYGNSSIWVAGSLLRSNKEVIISLPLSKRYLARIRASNEAGKSEWNYLSLGYTVAGALPADPPTQKKNKQPTTISGYTTVDFMEFFTIDDAQSKKHGSINLYRLEYNVNGGTFATPEKITGDTQTCLYLNQNDVDGVEIIVPDGNKNTRLSKNSITWTNWKQNSVGGSTYGNPVADIHYVAVAPTATFDPTETYYTSNAAVYTPDATVDASNFDTKKANLFVVDYKTWLLEPYKDYKDLTLIANYDTSVMDIEIFSDAKYAPKPGCLTVTPTDAAIEQKNGSSYCTITRTPAAGGAVSTVSWTFANKNVADEDVTYDKATLTVAKTSTPDDFVIVADILTGSISTDIANLESASYVATVNAYTKYKPKSPYQYKVYFELKD